ncbi:MAG: 5-(carboxyamino)imidazole ribonucleotide mutase [Aquiluna sp.]|jgi:5-(carboxyamino)imidazole ribonucleotide mutase|nr:5-(carboxyamino)imidazole ribonucleotide mutase [Aquiluna sp.]MDP5025640.1 5-(carboxyamino)imidazole ribonucleotide mutase [Aquiluna sp.]
MAKVAIVMGSDSDWRIMEQSYQVLQEFGVASDVEVLSAHRTPEKMMEFASSAQAKGYSVIVAGAGGAAHLPGMIASSTSLPVIGVPVSLSNLDGMDSLLSIVQMPAGVPVATVSIDGGRNAGLLALKILATSDAKLMVKLDAFREALKDSVEAKNQSLKSAL